MLFGVLCLPGDQSHPFAQPSINPLACCICWTGSLGRAVFPPWDEGPNFGSYSSMVRSSCHIQSRGMAQLERWQRKIFVDSSQEKSFAKTGSIKEAPEQSIDVRAQSPCLGVGKREGAKPLREHVSFFCILRAKSPHSHLTLCDPLDCRLPGSSVHGILQASLLEWVAMPSSRGSS